MLRPVLLALTLLVPAPLAARDALGVFGDWAAFRDPGVPRCYAIAMPEPSRAARDYQSFASVGTWPKRKVYGQIHFRLARKLAAQPSILLAIGGQRFALTGGGGDAWAADRTTDAAIVAAMRSARSMTISARDARGRRFSERYALEGAATALDAAALGCARSRR
jgi:hypothetical protein